MFLAWRALLRADKTRQREDLLVEALRLPTLPDERGAVESLECAPCAAWMHVPQRVCG